jgi:DNA-binding transcriptional MocR family regulator
MLEFAKDGNFEKHVDKVSTFYQHKRDVMLGALQERCTKYVSWNEPKGGYFLWLTLAENIDPKALAEVSREIGVQFVGGAGFHRGDGGTQNVRLAFSYTDEGEIPEGIMRFGRALEEATRK